MDAKKEEHTINTNKEIELLNSLIKSDQDPSSLFPP